MLCRRASGVKSSGGTSRAINGLLSTSALSTDRLPVELLAPQRTSIASAAVAPKQVRADLVRAALCRQALLEELLAGSQIEAVYNPLPNHLHVPLTLQAAQAGKHVLCEKPIALNAAEAQRLRAVADRVLIMEAFLVRFHPLWQRARDLVRQGQVGKLRVVQMLSSHFNNGTSCNGTSWRA